MGGSPEYIVTKRTKVLVIGDINPVVLTPGGGGRGTRIDRIAPLRAIEHAVLFCPKKGRFRPPADGP